MNANQSPSFDNHEHVATIDDAASGLRAIIAVHNTKLGPAVGGCRMFPYANEEQALEDVLRLSRGMTYKSALAGLPMGGGKAVIIGDPATQKSPALFHKMGEFIESLNGMYVTAEDSGTCVDDLRQIATETKHVLGVNDAQEFGGDPSPLTAYGIFCGIQSAVRYQLKRDSLNGTTVAVQGAGSVGRYLIKLLREAGAECLACDINPQNVARAEELGATIVGVNDIISADVDVFAPCAMGAILNDDSIPQLKATIVAGGANNQLAKGYHAQMLRDQGVLYAPDFVINAGGIIEIYRQYKDLPMEQCRSKIEGIGDTLTSIFEQSDSDNMTTADVAEKIAERRFKPNAKVNNAA
ncbi:Leu/Phe/Val dehydrogenase [Arenicella xantha]|uniref:Leucine dehydrogenase n=1 Tax=Arenicella xantha TaxID=644221 RepID=A0A395JNA5_9GAMM|nr:Glu/Leu/Phe/Val dehydrogenase dimerization domain-containing protein [Arenicella xantha]RBP53049.1 leucine dehydrogenase [Arenicella xantha]